MHRICYFMILILVLLIANVSFADSSIKTRKKKDSTEIEFLSNKKMFLPIMADPTEPKLRLGYNFNTQNLDANIGYSLEVIKINFDENSLGLGLESDIYLRLRSVKDFFPVDAINGLFGMHIAYKNETIAMRLKWIHISSHLVDGYEDLTNISTYSREFLQFNIDARYFDDSLRIYMGLGYVYSAHPNLKDGFFFQLGFEFVTPALIGDWFKLFIAEDFKLKGEFNYSLTNQLQVGILFGKVSENYFRLFFNYFTGRSEMGQLSNNKEDNYGINFSFHL